MTQKIVPSLLRICVVSQKFPLRGYYTRYAHVWPLLRSMAQKGHDVTVITSENWGRGDVHNFEGVTVHFVDKSIARSFGQTIEETIFEKIETLQAERAFDVVHCMDQTAYYLAQKKIELKSAFALDASVTSLDRHFGVYGLTRESVRSYLKTAWEISFNFLKEYWSRDRLLLKKADGVFCVSQQQKDLLERYYFVAARKSHVIPLGVEAPELASSVKDTNLLIELGIPADAQTVVTVSQFDEVGALKILISAFERVAIKKPLSYLIVAGDGPRFFEVEGHALNLALGNRVIFARHIPSEKLKDIVNLADVFVNTDSPTLGLEPSTLQAMLNRKMVIASEVGSASSFIESGTDGFLVHPTVEQDITQLVLEAFSGHLDVQAIGNSAHQKILKMFDTKRMVEKTVLAYKNIILSAR